MSGRGGLAPFSGMRVEGLDGLRKALERMDAAVSGDALSAIVQDAAKPIVAAATSLAPRATGRLQRSITMEFVRKGAGYAYWIVGPDKDVYYGRFQEFGLGNGATVGAKVVRRRERLAARRAAAAAKGKKYGGSFAGEQHTMPAHPFMRPAVRFAAVGVGQRIIEGIRRLLGKAVGGL